MPTFHTESLHSNAVRLLCASGLISEIADVVATTLVEADLLGHNTHGLQLLPAYLSEISKGTMTAGGDFTVITERSSVATWDGHRLPGPWLVKSAIDWARPRAQMHGSATVVIKRSHHIACLAAYLEEVARSGLMMLLYCSDPSSASVAPFGGTQAVFTPNPLAMAIPTSTDPIMLDFSASITTNGLSARMAKNGEKGAHPFWLDALGQPTNDPAVLNQQPPGTILPVGGVEAGHKGYSLALMVEALTAGLTGHGRADIPEGWGATVFLQLYDPEAFAGLAPFHWQTDYLVQACRQSAPRDVGNAVRLPGERGLALKQKQLRDGVQISDAIWLGLTNAAQQYNVRLI
jgi:LDH2 family malate/lactate/ureidoglycolate dehydrogenase